MKEKPYFPYLLGRDATLERYMRAALSNLPRRKAAKLYSAYASVHPHRLNVKYECGPEFTIAHIGSETIFFPSPIPLKQLTLTSCDYTKWLSRKYTFPGFVEVEFDDVVVDCGAFVGGFALSVVRRASHVYLFEPSVCNLRCVRQNIGNYDNVTIVPAALFNETSEKKFNISHNAVDHSLLAPDDGTISEVVTIQTYTLYDYCKENSIDRIDFCKVEAEGVEPEIIDGAAGVDIRKIAVDCSPERNGESPFDIIAQKLYSRGYEVRRRGRNLYAKIAEFPRG